MKKKILTLALVLMLLTSCLLPCATAFAQETELPNDGVKNTEKLFELRKDLDPYFEPKVIKELSTREYEEPYIPMMGGESVGVLLFCEKSTTYSVWKEFDFNYLEQVPDTPFAERKTVKIAFPIEYEEKEVEVFLILNGSTDAQPYPDGCGKFTTYFYDNVDLEHFLDFYDFKSFGVLQSNIKDIERSGDVLTAVYYETFYLCAKNSDGAFKNFYLDCNQTLYEYCKQDLEESKLLPNEIYQIFINDICNKYKLKLDGRKVEDLYGYWGFCAIPQGNVFNEFFQTVGTGAFLSPNIHYFQFIESVSWNENNELQKEYGKTTLGIIFNNLCNLFTGKLPCINAFLVYIEGGDSTILISKNGSSDLDNNMGAGGNGIVDGLQSIDWGSGFTKVFAVILALLIGVLAIVVVIKFVRRKR